MATHNASTSPPPSARPTRVVSPRGAAETRIEWGPGCITRHPHTVLRGFCPCAHCQGHQGGVRWVAQVESASKTALEILELQAVGHYALALKWADGHSGGIYTYPYLIELAALADAPLETLRGLQPRVRP